MDCQNNHIDKDYAIEVLEEHVCASCHEEVNCVGCFIYDSKFNKLDHPHYDTIVAVEKALDYQFEGCYSWDDMLGDCDLSEFEYMWAQDHLTPTVKVGA